MTTESKFWEHQRSLPHGPERADIDCVRHHRSLAYWAICIVGAAAVCCFAFVAFAAERYSPRPHEITLLLQPDPDRRNIITLSGAYVDRDACEKARKRLVVMVKGARTVCFPSN